MDLQTQERTDDGLVSRSDGLVLRGVDIDKRRASFIASTDSLDSYDERVEQKWDLKRFNRNPVVLYAHNKWDLPIGKAISCGLNKDKELECEIEFAPADANPEAEKVFKLIQGKFLRAVSVGFRPHSIRFEMENDVEVLILSDNELYEISVVPIPANPDALAKMKARAVRAETPSRAQTETSMDLKAAETKIAEHEATITRMTGEKASIEKALSDERTRSTSLTAELAARTTERDTARTALDEANKALDVEKDKVIGLEVDGLIGKKLLPSEKDQFVKLAKVDRGLFDDMVSKRPELNLTVEQLKAKEEASVNKRSADANDVSDIEKKLQK